MRKQPGNGGSPFTYVLPLVYTHMCSTYLRTDTQIIQQPLLMGSIWALIPSQSYLWIKNIWKDAGLGMGMKFRQAGLT